MRTLAAAWNTFWFAPAAPWPLGLCRAGFFASFYLLFLARTDLRWYALFPPGFYQPRSFFAWLSLPTPSWEVMGWLVTAFEISVILAALGLLTRWATLHRLRARPVRPGLAVQLRLPALGARHRAHRHGHPGLVAVRRRAVARRPHPPGRRGQSGGRRAVNTVGPSSWCGWSS